MSPRITLTNLRVFANNSETTLQMPRYGLLFLLVAIWIASQAAASDAFFEKALGKIEQTLVRPAESYGFVMTDTLTERLVGGVFKDGYSFYTLDGKVRYGHERYDPEKIEKGPYSSHLFVSQGEGGEAKAVDRGKNNKIVQSVGLNKAASHSIGQPDSYTYFATKAKNDERPDEQPFQILANPCFAPLKITPIAFQNLPVKALSDEDGNKVYEVRQKDGDDLMVLRLYFSPEHGDALVKSDYGFARTGTDGALEYRMRTIRAVEEWQNLPGGTLVPARFTYEYEQNGKAALSLVREISDAQIGNLDGSMFDTARIPEFNVPPDAVVNVEQTLRDAEAAAGLVVSRPSTGRIALLVGSVILLVVFVAVYFARHFSKQPPH